MSETIIRLPPEVVDVWQAICQLRTSSAHPTLSFTPDGKLVGDIGESIAASLYGLTLCTTRVRGVDGHSNDGRSVQIKTTGKLKRGPAFTPGNCSTDLLIFLVIDFQSETATIVYNGPEGPIREVLPEDFSGTVTLSYRQVCERDRQVADTERLLPLA